MISRLFILFLVFSTSFVQANLFGTKPSFLPADQAFAFSHTKENDQLQLHWQIAEGYYLYKKEIEITQNKKMVHIDFPQSENYDDEFFGQVEIFRNQLQLTIPYSNDEIHIRYQGCTKGFCYPPETITLNSAEQAVGNSQNIAINTQNENTANIVSEQDKLANQLTQNRFTILWFFVLGLGLAFTPCVLPMLPLLSAIVIGNKQRPNNGRALLLSFSYVQGMALTYTLLGLIVAAIGLPFQIALQSPPVLITLAILFSLLALSMFGGFTLQLPNSWQQKLHQLSQQQQGGSLSGVFIMGMIAGLVASPCTSAPLSGALLYVAQSGDLFTGGLALYLLALGMGIPLILITLFGNRILPKSGEWLIKVKNAFGFVMLALPAFLLSRVFPNAEHYLWSLLAIAFLIWLIEQIEGKNIYKITLRFLLIFAVAIAAKPWTDWLLQSPQANAPQTSHFIPIHSLAELNQQLAQHKGKKAMLDLYADWCVACKEFEKYTFTDKDVQIEMENILMLQVDMTKNSPENNEIMKHFNVLGLPTILFFDEQGKELTSSRVTGFMDADEFLTWLKQL